MIHVLNSFIFSSNFPHLLITFANSFDPDQDRQIVGPDLDPNCLTLIVILDFFFLKKSNSAENINGMKNYPARKELNIYAHLSSFTSIA